MKKISNRKSNIFLQIASCLLLLSLLVSYLTCGVLARYSSVVSGTANVRPARFAYDGYAVQNEQQVEVFTHEGTDANSTKTTPIYVQNYTTVDGTNKISEITLNYTIVIETTGTIPVTYVLKDSNDAVVDLSKEITGTMAPAEAIQHEYTLEITRADSSIEGAEADTYDDIAYVTVSVKWMQVD